MKLTDFVLICDYEGREGEVRGGGAGQITLGLGVQLSVILRNNMLIH